MAAFRALAIFDVVVVVMFGLFALFDPMVFCIVIPVGFGLAVINVAWLILAAVIASASQPQTRCEAAINTFMTQAEARGWSHHQIVTQLRRNGWTDEEIQKARRQRNS
jgi:hypothetical protein